MQFLDRFLDAHWRDLTQALIDAQGFRMEQAIHFVEDAAEAALRLAWTRGFDEVAEAFPEIDVPALARRNGLAVLPARAGLELVAGRVIEARAHESARAAG